MKKSSNKEFIKKAKNKFGRRYIYSKVRYKGAEIKVKIICSKHGIFKTTPHKHLEKEKSKTGYLWGGCPKCGNEQRRNSQLRSQKETVKQFRKIHGNKYSYSKVKYRGNAINVIIVCRKHKGFLQAPKNHLKGMGCNKCGHDIGKKKRAVVLMNKGHSGSSNLNKLVIKRFKKIHKNTYDYSRVKYENYHKEVKIICKKHGEFLQRPAIHLRGNGCLKCGREKTIKASVKFTQKMFVNKCRKIHNNKYDYSLVKFRGFQNKIKVVCPEHGSWSVKALNHYYLKRGCPKCFHPKIKQNLWLDSLNLPDNEKHREVYKKIKNKRYYFDGYNPKTKTVYEFLGDYHHGNPKIYRKNDLNKKSNKTFGMLYKKTLQKSKTIKDAGFNFVRIWENEWDKK